DGIRDFHVTGVQTCALPISFIADIHGNGVALDAVLEDIERQKVDRIAVLGDIAFRGPEPKRVLERVRSLSADVIKGNADEWTVRSEERRVGKECRGRRAQTR